VAGPSKPSSRGKRKRTTTPPPPQDEEEEKEEIEEIAPPVERKSTRSTKAGRPPTSGQSHQRQASGSSKAKAAPARRGKGKQESEQNGSRAEEVMDVDSVREVRTEPESEEVEVTLPRVGATRQAVRGRRDVEEADGRKEERMQKQIDLLQKYVEQVRECVDVTRDLGC
jgi:hypothetical protein